MGSTRTMKLYPGTLSTLMPSTVISAANSSVKKEMRRSARSPYFILTPAQRYQVGKNSQLLSCKGALPPPQASKSLYRHGALESLPLQRTCVLPSRGN